VCGISGIVYKKNIKINPDEIKRINRLVDHRGPDGEGYYFGDNFSLGHRRLSIFDLSEKAHQPMAFKDKYQIIFNGAIYNYLELKNQLKDLGYHFTSKSDTEVILASYDYWGEQCVDMLNGMWAFTIFNKSKNILFCSRDRFGIKPFYFSETDERFIFGSEIKQILSFVDSKLNKQILVDYLCSGYEDHNNETFFKNIYKLEQSHNLIYDLSSHNFEIKKYYDLIIDQEIESYSQKDAFIAYKNALSKSLELRNRSDVKLGTCLSGGIDSSIIAAKSSMKYDSIDQFNAINAKSTEPKIDESSFAKIVSNKFNLKLSMVQPTYTDFIDSVDDLVYKMDEPFGTPSNFMQYYVFKKAKEIGCKVMLDGQGADETMLGYERYIPSILLNKGNYFINLLRSKSRLSKFKLLLYTIYFKNAFIKNFIIAIRYRFLKKEALNRVNRSLLKNFAKSYNNIKEMQIKEIMSLQLPHLLKYEDRSSMANSIEARVPFIDHNVVEIAISMNDDFKIKDGKTKYFLRLILDELGLPEISQRTDKIGFWAPSNKWLSKFSKEIIDEIKNSKIVNIFCDTDKIEKKYYKINDNFKWKLYNIAKWEKLFKVKV
tara:strand:- start:90 stop:1889 length:1800 start_codon:yes stop_codon:yes gene_type:complete